MDRYLGRLVDDRVCICVCWDVCVAGWMDGRVDGCVDGLVNVYEWTGEYGWADV